MTDKFYLWLVVALLTTGALTIAWYSWSRRRRQVRIAAPPTALHPDRDRYRVVEFAGIPSFSRSELSISGQSSAWKSAMLAHGETLERAGIGAIFFVHGTFVGNDPWGVAHTLKELFPRFGKRLIPYIHKLTRSQSNLLLRDQANFLPQYVDLARHALGGRIDCREFRWSSGNHHSARLQGALELVQYVGKILSRENHNATRRVLMLGHSHAGQVFALFAHIISESFLGQKLLALAHEFSVDQTLLHEGLVRCQATVFDFATFGTPYQYDWPPSSEKHLVHVINHRGEISRHGRRRGVPFTKDGDYVQQWGALGSDFPAVTAKERALNRELDRLLGVGIDRRGAEHRIRRQIRVPPFGYTFLVDYGDQGRILPNFFATVFGHGVYTRFEAMEFNFRLVCESLYPSES